MPGLRNITKEHWEKGTFIVGAATEAVIAFEKRLAELSLEARIFLAALSGIVAVWSVAEMLRRNRVHAVGFQPREKDAEISVGWIAVRGGAILVVCGFGIFLFVKTATYHSLSIV